MSGIQRASLNLFIEAFLETHALEHVQVLFFLRGFDDIDRASSDRSVGPFHQKSSNEQAAQEELRNLPVKWLLLLLLMLLTSFFPVLAIEVSISSPSCTFLRRQRPGIFLRLIFC